MIGFGKKYLSVFLGLQSSPKEGAAYIGEWSMQIALLPLFGKPWLFCQSIDYILKGIVSPRFGCL